MSSSLQIDVKPVRDMAGLPEIWTGLSERAAEGAFFQSWPWIESWAAWLPPAIEPMALIARRGETPVAGAILVENRHRTLRRLRPAQWCLSETGQPDLDRLHIEYNDFLMADGDPAAVRREILTWLLRHGPVRNALVLNRVTEPLAEAAVDVARNLGRPVEIWQKRPTFRIDLRRLRQPGGDFFDDLSRNTRWQIRRAMRLYEKAGPIAFERAQSTEEADDWFDTMCAVHKSAWSSRRIQGAFTFPPFTAFHADFVSKTYKHGLVDLCRMTAGGEVVGILYNLIWHRQVLNYQSGFVYADTDNRLKPGLICHALASQHYAKRGFTDYDLLGGGGHYKARIAQPSSQLVSLTIGSNRSVYRMERMLRRLRPVKQILKGSASAKGRMRSAE